MKPYIVIEENLTLELTIINEHGLQLFNALIPQQDKALEMITKEMKIDYPLCDFWIKFSSGKIKCILKYTRQ